jgi:hypothetical protein
MPHNHYWQLVLAIERDPFISRVFQPPFNTLAGWRDYWGQRGNAVSPLFGSGATWTAADFQALYIACWLYQPLEKGSFMIPIDQRGHQLKVAEAMTKLPTRWSSHLSKKGARTAGQNYRFLVGYSELLVQYEQEHGSRTAPSLFLKTEGHGAASVAHLSSWVTKSRTGRGNTANDLLHRLAQNGEYGIKARAAENYDKPYEKLLKYLELTPTVCTVEEAVLTIYSKLTKKATLVYAEDIDESKLASFFIYPLVSKANQADLITKVIIPTINQPNLEQGKFITAVKKAEPALLEIADCLRRDAQDKTLAGVPRVFQEVRVTIAQLDQALQQFLDEMRVWRTIQ